MMNPSEGCHTCGNSLEWHEQQEGIVRHPFNNGSLPHSATFGQRRADGSRGRVPDAQRGSQVPSPWPFDPVLRQALVDKGVLTVEDLQEAETKIRTITSTVHGTVDHKPTVYRGGGSDGEQRGGSEGVRISGQT